MLERQFGLLTSFLLPVRENDIQGILEVTRDTSDFYRKRREISMLSVHYHPGGQRDLALVFGRDLLPTTARPFVPALAKVGQEGNDLGRGRSDCSKRRFGCALLRGVEIVEFCSG
jgi:hypothetical protein